MPKKFDDSAVPSFVKNYEQWILKHWEKQSKQAEIRNEARVLPQEIVLPALGETWRIERDKSVGNSRLIWEVRRSSGEYCDAVHLQSELSDVSLVNKMTLKTSPETDDPSLVCLLKRWLTIKAKSFLIPKVKSLAEELGFKELNNIRIGCQKTLWGSCNVKGVISLNCKLLFLPPPLLNHVLLHELCHLREMNHSVRFHELLSKFDHDSEKNSALIRDQWAFVPGWIEIA